MESWVFNKKEIRFIADLITAGGKVGFPYNISRVFRSKKLRKMMWNRFVYFNIICIFAAKQSNAYD